MSNVFIISAPSGSGKSTLVKSLLADDAKVNFSISFTTRQPRGAERDGGSYHFVSREDFERRIAAGEFLEYAEVFGNYYGTNRDVLDKARREGKDLVLDIDVQGARQLRSKVPDAVSVFILAPSRQELEARLRARSEDSDEVIERRLCEAAREIEDWRQYDYVLVNDDLTASIRGLKQIVESRRRREEIVEAEQLRTSRPETKQRVAAILSTFAESGLLETPDGQG